ncbi:MAG: cation:proton antiporter [Nitrospinota bacterium]|nr:cation:proton antiporter [Nitrospinota bacterium]
MQTHDFFLILLIILLSARVLAELAVRLHTPSVIGELLAGVVLGPSLLGWIEPMEAIKLMAEIGILLLLFEVGLGTDPQQLARAGLKSLIVALAGFILPFMLGFAVGYWAFGLPLLVSMFIGGTLTATSIGITVRVLTDLKRQHSSEGQIILGAAILDDVMGVILLALLYEFSIGGGVTLGNVGKVILFVAAFFILAPMAAKLMSAIIKHINTTTEIPGLIPTTIVSLVLFFAWLAHIMGAPELLGGFAAGLALSRRFFLPFGAALHADPFFAEHIETEMKPIIHLFTPIFFVMVGLSLNLREIDWNSPFIWVFSGVLMVVAIIGKLAGPWLIREPWPTRWIIGTAMIPRGEVGLIFAELGRASGILNNEIYAGMIIVITLTTVLSPFAMKGLFSRFSQRLQTAVND